MAVQGNVGIGATTANSTLSVAGNAHIGSIRQGITAPTDGLFVDGNVGIGVTTSLNKLDVNGNARIFGSFIVDGNIGIGFSSPTNKLDVADTAIRIRENTSAPTLTQDGQFAIGSVGTTANDGRFWVRSQGTSFRFTSDANTADYSEYFYQGTTGAESGDIMVVDQNPSPILDTGRVTKSTTPYQGQILGVITVHGKGTGYNNPDDNRQNDEEFAEVGLLGHIAVKVSTENGPIKVGDFLTSSSTPGVAMKALRPGTVIGKALEEFTGNSEQLTGNTATDNCELTTDNYCIGKVLTFVSASYADPNNFFSSLSMDSEGNLIIPKVKVGSLVLDSSLASLSEQLSVNS